MEVGASDRQNLTLVRRRRQIRASPRLEAGEVDARGAAGQGFATEVRERAIQQSRHSLASQDERNA
jgi:hypothetical protein